MLGSRSISQSLLTRSRTLGQHVTSRQTRPSYGSVRNYTPIKSLQDAFRDPSSPFHIAPGTQGPAHPEDHNNMSDYGEIEEQRLIAEDGRRKLLELGYDPTSFWEQQIVWGDHDSFQHVNNVRYVRFFESGRIKWMESLGREIGGPTKATDMIRGNGVSLILKSISLNYKRPVTYPDTLLIAHKPHLGGIFSSSNIDVKDTSDPTKQKLPKTHFHVYAAAYSFAQKRIVTESDSVLVWYDYDKLMKCDPGKEVRAIVEKRMVEGLMRQKEALAIASS